MVTFTKAAITVKKPLFAARLARCIPFVFIFGTLADEQKLFPLDGNAGDHFGYSVAIDNGSVLVGAFKADVQGVIDAGAAYIFAKTDDKWLQRAKLVAAPLGENDTLGGNVALKYPFAMLGVRNRDDAKKDAGAVFAFEFDGTAWSQTQILTAHDAKESDTFGQSIALSDEFLVIGAPHHDTTYSDAGAVYVFERSNMAWQFKTKLTAPDGGAGDLYGISVALDGHTLLVGADLHDEQSDNAGAVYAYSFENNVWRQQGKLMASDGDDTDIFGVRVAVSKDIALISARRDDIEGVGVDAGSVYVFERHKGVWKQSQKLLAPDGRADDRFGRGIALSGDTAVISAMHHDIKAINARIEEDEVSNAGALYIFKRREGRWQFDSKRAAKDGAVDDRFGWNIAISDSTVVVGTPQRDEHGDASGSAYIVDIKKAP